MIPPVLCVIGPSGSGKTRLLEQVVSALSRAGLRVGAVKHCHRVDAGSPRKDSHRLAEAGAAPSVAAAEDALQVGRARRETLLPDLLATFCQDCDLVLAEGYARSAYDKIVLGLAAPQAAPQGEGARLCADGRSPEDVAEWASAWLQRRRAGHEGLTGVVLTGGQSRRMGADKTSLRVAAGRVLGRLAGLLADRVGQVMFVGAQPDGRDLPASLCGAWHPDDVPGRGPLGGVATALRVSAAARRPTGVCVVACDMPAVGGALLDHLLAGRDPQAHATVPINPLTGCLEPLLAIYEPRALGAIEQAMQAGELSLTDWLLRAGPRRLPLPPELAGQCANVNTPAELDRLRSRLEGGRA
jgi:molybdopterin-guanine dinucleotide biosynthesis protein MobB